MEYRQPVVMGVLNVTPDSFSDGGRYTNLGEAVAHAVRMHQQGAQLIDVGGESTRPGAGRVDPETETARVLPVIRELATAKVPMSIDTTRAGVAAAALEAGAQMVNDVSGGLADPDMAKVVAQAGCPWVLMHWRGHSRRMREMATYHDVVAEVRAELVSRVEDALAAGVRPENLIIDPGLGFAKTAEHNWLLSAHLDQIMSIGYPVLLGASRKSYLGSLLAGPDGVPRPVHEREAATVATTVLAVAAGVWGVRVHNVQSTVDAIRVWQATRAHQLDTPDTRAAQAPAPSTRPARVPTLSSPAPGTITRTGRTVRGYHGVYDFERATGQDFVVDVHLDIDLDLPARSDQVADTVHYGELADRLVAIVGGPPVNLIETLAARLAEACLDDARVRTATVTVHKPQAPIAHTFTDVAVTVRRDRQ